MLKTLCDLMSLTMKNTAIPLLSVAILAFPACVSASSMLRSADRVPDWYEERRKEIRGDGYPALSSVPEPVGRRGADRRAAEAGERGQILLALFLEDPRGLAAPADPATAEAVQRSIMGRFAEELPPGNFLTDAEIASLRASFDVPRVTRGLRTGR
jgi:hypothetical protein